MIGQTVVQPPVSGQPITRDGLTCKIQYSACGEEICFILYINLYVIIVNLYWISNHLTYFDVYIVRISPILTAY